jgi:hypothetical protein
MIVNYNGNLIDLADFANHLHRFEYLYNWANEPIPVQAVIQKSFERSKISVLEYRLTFCKVYRKL